MDKFIEKEEDNMKGSKAKVDDILSSKVDPKSTMTDPALVMTSWKS